MLRSALSNSVRSFRPQSQRLLSTAADTGPLSTRVHHAMSLALAVATPIYFFAPDSITEGAFGKGFGLLLTGTITAHSHIGLNYVATDYVPKISKALLPPARVAILGLSGITFAGMSAICLASPGGLKGVVKGVWNPLPEKKKEH